eukprot:2944478-Pleurochrysis_carterae.AAC.4
MGLITRQTRGLPSCPRVSYPGGGWQYTTSPERLFVVDAGDLGAALHAQPCLECSVAFAFVHPDETDKRSSGGYGVAVDHFPTAAVAGMVGDLRPFRCGPSGTVVTQGLLAGLGASLTGRRKQNTAGVAG